MRKIFVIPACAFAVHSAVQEDPVAVRAEMRCERIEAPGRVRCEVEARVAPGQTIATGDVVIVRTPAFVTALRGRIGPHDATTREAEVWRWGLALAAREKGTGDVEARVRVVVCRGAACTPHETPVTGRVVVGEGDRPQSQR